MKKITLAAYVRTGAQNGHRLAKSRQGFTMKPIARVEQPRRGQYLIFTDTETPEIATGDYEIWINE